MARRKPAAPTRRPKGRSRSSATPRVSLTGAPIDAGRFPASQAGPGTSAADEPQALVVTHWFDSGQGPTPYSATIRLTGRLRRADGQVKQADSFVQEDRIEGIVPGSGPVSVTSWVYGLQPGEWTVTAELIRPSDINPSEGRWQRPRPEQLARAEWSWRHWKVSRSEATPLRTRWAQLAPLARIPAVIPGSFTLMGSISILVAISIIAALLAGAGIPATSSVAVSILAIVAGLAGAKVWYAILHPGPWPKALLGGWSVDGFIVIAPIAAIGALLAMDLPVGLYLDAAAPAIFFAVAIGRFGCFFTGCCAGRCTASRWGVWSSDRKIGARRIPAQLLESGAGLVIAIGSLALVVGRFGDGSGEVFVGAIAAYIIARQFLLRTRAERREFSWRRSQVVPESRT